MKIINKWTFRRAGAGYGPRLQPESMPGVALKLSMLPLANLERIVAKSL